jgi:two-component system, sensor histidine kinase PdtaS
MASASTLTPSATSATMAVTVMSVLFCTWLPSVPAGYRVAGGARSLRRPAHGLACAGMGSLDRLAAERTDLAPAEVEYLQAVVGSWALVADLAMGDLVLWLPTWNAAGWWAAALIRPTTAPTTVPEDIVGTFTPRGRFPALDRAGASGRTVPLADDGQAVPVHFGERVIAVITRQAPTRRAGRLEEVYAELAEQLLAMVGEGRFPPRQADWAAGSAPPRVGDGLLRVDADGRVRFASPNAVSAFRRLGLARPLEGEDLATIVTRLWHRPGPVSESLALAASGRIATDAEVENPSACVTLRSVPLTPGGRSDGAIVLVRDITDLRRRERALMSKDASLREVHHRVKNNLQTVGALLRLQSRRAQTGEARESLAEAGRRVAAIAAIHEVLAQEPGDRIDFDAVLDRIIAVERDLSAAYAPGVLIDRQGSIGIVDTELASPLAMAVSELLHNAVEHSGAGRIDVVPARAAGRMMVDVRDDGRGMPQPPTEGLGLQIVRSLVEQDLRGELGFDAPGSGGCSVRVSVADPG